MRDEKINHILASEEALIPSSGFVSAVMERIREEAAAPPPIPFPWKRFVPGAVLAMGGLGWGAVELTRQAIKAARSAQPVLLQIPDSLVHPMETAGWVALALGISWASWMVARRAGGESRLL
jgi:hypothetical protein